MLEEKSKVLFKQLQPNKKKKEEQMGLHCFPIQPSMAVAKGGAHRKMGFFYSSLLVIVPRLHEFQWNSTDSNYHYTPLTSLFPDPTSCTEAASFGIIIYILRITFGLIPTNANT